MNCEAVLSQRNFTPFGISSRHRQESPVTTIFHNPRCLQKILFFKSIVIQCKSLFFHRERNYLCCPASLLPNSLLLMDINTLLSPSHSVQTVVVGVSRLLTHLPLSSTLPSFNTQIVIMIFFSGQQITPNLFLLGHICLPGSHSSPVQSSEMGTTISPASGSINSQNGPSIFPDVLPHE